MLFGHHELPEHLQHTLAEILHIFETLSEQHLLFS